MDKTKRKTSSIILIEKFLQENPHHHFSAGQILEVIKQTLPSVNLSTVHRNLKNLVIDNKASISDIGIGVPVFESRGSPHHHLVCSQCGKINDLEDSLVQSFFNQVLSQKHDFSEIKTNHLILYGFCQTCKESQKSAE